MQARISANLCSQIDLHHDLTSIGIVMCGFKGKLASLGFHGRLLGNVALFVLRIPFMADSLRMLMLSADAYAGPCMGSFLSLAETTSKKPSASVRQLE